MPKNLPPKVQAFVSVWTNPKHQHARIKVNGILFTTSEACVLVLLAAGCSYKDVAAIMKRSESTIDKHSQSLRNKTKIRTLVGLTHYAITHGLINPGDCQ